MRITSSVTRDGICLSFNGYQTVSLFRWFGFLHSFIAGNSFQDSDSQGILVNRVNVFATYFFVALFLRN